MHCGKSGGFLSDAPLTHQQLRVRHASPSNFSSHQSNYKAFTFAISNLYHVHTASGGAGVMRDKGGIRAKEFTST